MKSLLKKKKKKTFPQGRSSGEVRRRGLETPGGQGAQRGRRSGRGPGLAGLPDGAPRADPPGRVGPGGQVRALGSPQDRRLRLRDGESSTCHAGPAGLEQLRGSGLPEELGRGAARGNGARPRGQALKHSTQRAPGQPQGDGQEPAQALQAFHGAGSSRR